MEPEQRFFTGAEKSGVFKLQLNRFNHLFNERFDTFFNKFYVNEEKINFSYRYLFNFHVKVEPLE